MTGVWPMYIIPNNMIEQKLQNMKLTATEDIIADFIRSCDDLRHVSARQIASAVGTAPSTVTRFIRKLGYTSYASFIDAYEEERREKLFAQNVDPNYPFDYRDKNNIIAAKISLLYKDIIDETLSYITHDRMAAILSQLRKAQTIVVTGAGVAIDVAKTFEDKMLRIRKDVIIEDKPYQAYTRASLCDLSTVFLILSYSGETENILRVARKAKERGIPLIAITRYGDSTLSRLADGVLYVSAREHLYDNLGSYAMNVATLFLLDTLYTAIFNEDYKDHAAAKEKTRGYDLYRDS